MEVSLDLSLAYVPKTISEYLREVSMVKDSGLKLKKLDDYVSRLEEEMRKIDAFKRELPLCMLLLNDAIVRLKEEVMLCNKEAAAIVAGKGDSGDGKGGSDISEKKNWMSSVQLWNTNPNPQKQDSKSETKQRSEEEDDRSTCENPIQLGNSRTKGGAFVPFNNKSNEREEKEVVSQVTGLSLMTNPSTELVPNKMKPNNSAFNQIMMQNLTLQQQQQQQAITYRAPPESPNKKQRRCWSPELHRRFVDSLQQLGGSQAATPKQIRELMQVDGLTNDEVKSHLQKYRLHLRKHVATNGNPNTLWAGQEQSKDPPKAAISLSKGTTSNEREDDEKSESHSWNGRLERAGEN